jgi:hypothetical protein
MIIFDHLIDSTQVKGIGPLEESEFGEQTRLSCILYLNGCYTQITSDLAAHADPDQMAKLTAFREQYSFARTIIVKNIHEEEKVYEKHCKLVNTVTDNMRNQLNQLFQTELVISDQTQNERVIELMTSVFENLTTLRNLAVK